MLDIDDDDDDENENSNLNNTFHLYCAFQVPKMQFNNTAIKYSLDRDERRHHKDKTYITGNKTQC